MRTTSPSPGSRRRTVATRLLQLATASALALPLLLTGATGTAAAAAAPTDTADHPELHYAGSTIPAHEGGQGTRHAAAAPGGVPGIDVSHFQGSIDWAAVAGQNRFVYMKATEGTSYKDANFSSYYNGSAAAGLIRGAYHFARPDSGPAAAQAQFFVGNGGGWSPDGKTLPPMLDIEYAPSGDSCYGLNPAQMSGWIAEFSNEVHRLTGRYPTIYSTKDWWNTCTGSNPNFTANPLAVAKYSTAVGELPAGWSIYTFWQYSSTGATPGIGGNVDQDVFNGSIEQLQRFAGTA